MNTALLQPVRQWAASLTQLTASLPRIGADEVSELEQAVTLFRRWDASGAGGLRRKAVAGQLNAVAESLRDDHPPELTMRLFQVTAELAQLAGGWPTTRDCSAPPAAETRSSLVVNWLLRFHRALAGRYPDVPDVTRFHDQLREYLRKAAPTRAGEL